MWVFRRKEFDLKNLGGGAAATQAAKPSEQADARLAEALAH